MTVEEKKAKVGEYCLSRLCGVGCLLYGTHINNTAICCIDIAKATECDLDEALEIINRPETEPENDPVNRPSHYTDGKIEVIEFIEDKNLGFCLGNAVKYIARAGKKDPTAEAIDIRKAIWYLNRYLKELGYEE